MNCPHCCPRCGDTQFQVRNNVLSCDICLYGKQLITPIKSYGSSIINKFIWFKKRFGILEMFKKTFTTLFSYFYVTFLEPRFFIFDYKYLKNFYHKYSTTWRNERQIEIPIFRSLILPNEEAALLNYHHLLNKNVKVNVLEVGNVLSHYGCVGHTIVDKYEKAPNVLNIDILDYIPDNKHKFDKIISISTFEHIGYDESEPTLPSETKIPLVIEHCRKLLTPEGQLIISMPFGYNSAVNAMILSGSLKPRSVIYMATTDPFSNPREWSEISQTYLEQNCYKPLFQSNKPYANMIAIMFFDAL